MLKNGEREEAMEEFTESKHQELQGGEGGSQAKDPRWKNGIKN